MSPSIAPSSADFWVSSTIQYTAASRTQERMRNRVANNAAERKLSDLRILVGRKESVSGAAHGLNHVALEPLIDFCTQPADVTFHHAGLRIEMDAPHIL